MADTIERLGRDEQIGTIAHEVLGALKLISNNAARIRSEGGASIENVLVSYNAITSVSTTREYSRVGRDIRESLEILICEPALVRVKAGDENGNVHTYYICRETAHGPVGTSWKLAGRNTAIGRLASGKVGHEIDIALPNKGVQSFEILEKAVLVPSFASHEWDSIRTQMSGGGYGTLTVDSLKNFLVASARQQAEEEPFEKTLRKEEMDRLVHKGTLRAVITKMGLRDQPILDEFQDAVFRLPLDNRLLIMGPPGTGKTTTLIRRLGFMAHPNPEQQHDRDLIERARYDGAPDHSDSWLMFTPTDLLKDYLQEAFNRERIPAPDRNVCTWTYKRRELARNHFRILRAGDGKGAFTHKENELFIRPETLANQIPWFEDFDSSQQAVFWSELASTADALAALGEPDVHRLASALSDACRRGRAGQTVGVMIELVEASVGIRGKLETLREQTRDLFEGSLRIEQRKDSTFAQQFAAFLDSLRQPDDDADDDEEDDVAVPPGRMQAMQRAYVSNLRRQSLSLHMKDRLRPSSRAGQIAQWIGQRRPDDEKLSEIGKIVRLQRLLTVFSDPLKRYVNRVPNRYRQFRRDASAAAKWYIEGKVVDREAGAAEVDLMLLASMRLPAALLEERRVLNELDEPRWSIAADLRHQMRNQIAVDEATDFSPVQLMLMGLLGSRMIQSFFACGDFNQRITNWGTKSDVDIRWAFPDINVQHINIAYRHSQQLGHLASEIVRVCSGEAVTTRSPENMDNTGYMAVLGSNLSEENELVQWLANRIGEIERLSHPLPTVAVLVNDERQVVPIATALAEALQDYNLNVEPCVNGRNAGSDNDIRVFDVQHIKGLEFEAVFFVDVDELAELKPDLFDKFLYVGATRAANFLGLTCRGGSFPRKLESLRSLFGESWSG